MIRKNKWKLVASSLVILLPVAVGLLLWNDLPREMTTHWDLNGAANGTVGRGLVVFGLPLMLLAGHWVGILVTSLDPNNRDQTPKAMGLIFWICPFISLLTAAIAYSGALGMNFGPSKLYLMLGPLFIIIGNLMPKCRRNYTIGIKVKWALESDANWNATHRFGGKLWVIGGALLTLCSFLPASVVHYVSFAGIILLAVIPGVYSYLFYRRQRERGEVAASAPMSAGHRRFRAILLVVILLAVAILLFSGDIRIRYGDASFTVEASYFRDLTVDYASIESIEYLETNPIGSRTGGFGSLRLQMGNYRNAEFGDYTRYSYTMSKTCVALTVDGRMLVLSGPDAARTEAIFSELSSRIEK